MKIAVISDIHGNHYALEKVLEEARKEGVEKIIALGDYVGYYYHPEIVIDLLLKWPVEMIKGNHEVILQNLYENKIDPIVLKEKYGSGHEYALKNLSKDVIEWLFDLPVQKSVKFADLVLQLNHGTPWDKDEYLYPDAEKSILEKCNSNLYDFVLIGHSHYSFSYKCTNSLLINVGSVGQSRQKGGYASWTLINVENGSYQMRSTAYDTSKLINEVQAIDPNNLYSSKILMR